MFLEVSDCIWVILAARREQVTFPTGLLSEMDWRSRGILSKIVRGNGRGSQRVSTEVPFSQTVFIPVEGKLPAKICAIDTVATFEPGRFKKNVEGLKAKKVIVIFEDLKVRSQVEARIEKMGSPFLFEHCVCLEDQA